MLGVIEISVIPQDLRHEETIVQIANTLDNLDSAINQIFEYINNRIVQNSNRLKKIKERALNVQDKLEFIQSNLSLKAVKMYSAAKYPAINTYKEYERTVKLNLTNQNNLVNFYKCNVPIEDEIDTLLKHSQRKNKQYATINMQEKLQFYHLRQKRDNKSKTTNVQIKPKVSSVSALLPFDNVKSSYELSSIITSNQNNEKLQIEDAPDSILQPWYQSEVESPSSYMYAPALGEVPQISVPLTLPYLQGIVDERFVLDAQSQNPIAPSSAAVTPTVKVDLPTLIPELEQSNININPKTIDLPILVENPSIESKNDIKSVPPPPPPPPLISSSSEKPSRSYEPPIPPTPPPFEIENTGHQLNTQISSKLNISDDRSSLMAAIRNAGGFGKAKLKPAPETVDKNDRWASASIEEDLMADLHAKLLQRRKNIIGISSETFKRMSNMIPPPPTACDSNDRNSATSECESQPDDEWDD